MELCLRCRLPLRGHCAGVLKGYAGADETLRLWKEEAAEREAAEEEVKAAIEAEDPVAVRELVTMARCGEE